MGVPVLIIGRSGAGKSASMRNLNPEEIGIFNVASKVLPFKKKMKVSNHPTYESIEKALIKNNLKAYVIDDSQFLMAFEQLARANESGYKKYTDIGLHFYALVETVINRTSEDTIVYFLHHTESTEAGEIKAKTVGKLIDNWLTLEGLFSIVIHATVDNDGHWFVTQTDGQTTAKSPMGMFPLKMDNDLKAIDDAIRAYYEFVNPEKLEKETKE